MKIRVVKGYEVNYFDCNRPVPSPLYEYIEVDRNELMKGIKRDKLRELREKKREIESKVIKYMNNDFHIGFYRDQLRKIDIQIRKFKTVRKTGGKQPYIQADDVRQNATAREILEQYGISIGRTGMIRCIEHDDRTPSMKVYEYNAHCFGCQRTFDTIAIIMALEPCDFKTAIRRLAN